MVVSPHILLITYYYPPDLSAGSFRAKALVEALLDHTDKDARLTVITTTPNRYANMTLSADDAALDPRVSLLRIDVPSHASGMADQARGFVAFARKAMAVTKQIKPDIVVGTSSRLMTASLAARIARRAKAKLYLDIRDIFSETIGDVIGGLKSKLLLPPILALERRTLRSADRVNLVSPAFADYFLPRVGRSDFATFTNGVDDLFIDEFGTSSQSNADRDERPVILFAGNMGEGQGLDRIVPELAAACPHMDFRMVGGGGRRQALVDAVEDAGLTNVQFVDPVARDKLVDEYRRASILFMHLNDFPAFKRVLPSKIFEYAVTGKPVLAGVGGFARKFTEEHVTGSACFDPCNTTQAIEAVRILESGPATYDRTQFAKSFARSSIMREMAQDILSLA